MPKVRPPRRMGLEPSVEPVVMIGESLQHDDHQRATMAKNKEEAPDRAAGKESMPTDGKGNYVNPIDGDKIAENAHLLAYGAERGGATIKAIDKGKIKGLAMNAMYEQTDMQLDQIKAQIELLARQANEIQNRMTISEEIYAAEMNIDPIVGRTYYLYRRPTADGTLPPPGLQRAVLSLIAPAEWGPRPPYHYVATVKLLADHTWEILERTDK